MKLFLCAVLMAALVASQECVQMVRFDSQMAPSAGPITFDIAPIFKPFVTYVDGPTVSVQIFGPEGAVAGVSVSEDHTTRVVKIIIPNALLPRAADDSVAPSHPDVPVIDSSSHHQPANAAGSTASNIALVAAGAFLAARGNGVAAAAAAVPAAAYYALAAKPADRCALHVVITRPATTNPANLIMVISDGHSVSSITMARKILGSYWLDDYLVGAVRTSSASSQVTDSAASATAYSCAIKTNNDWLGVNPSNKSCRTILEAARDKGMATGLTVTSTITHATPGAFYAHSWDRDLEYWIGDQLYNSDLTVALGGGSKFFQKKLSKYGNKTVLDMFRTKGYRYVGSKSELLAAGSEPKLFGTFAPGHMPMVIDRINGNMTEMPLLTDEVKIALPILDKAAKASGKGFFLMIEASLIDQCAHRTDASCIVGEVQEFLDATKLAFDYAKTQGNTAVVVTSDHETGGISLGATSVRVQNEPSIYYYHPEEIRIKWPTMSFMWIENELISMITAPLAGGQCGKDGKLPHNLTIDEVTKVVKKYLNIKDWSDEDAKYVLATQTMLVSAAKDVCNIPGSQAFAGALGSVLTKRSYVSFATQSHTGGDVMLYAYNAPGLKGNMDNTDLGKWMAKYLGVDNEVPKILTRRDARNFVEMGENTEKTPKHPYD
eukprot:m51a1_g3440 hypothetical protein (662) ;mRNA; f:653418-655638